MTQNNNIVGIGNKISIHTNTYFSCKEGTKIFIGNECMFAANVIIRSSDEHSIINLNNGKRVNLSQDVKIGNRVWFGEDSKVNKGVVIPNNCVIGTGSIVTKKFLEENVVIAGIPAKIIKRDITWEIELK